MINLVVALQVEAKPLVSHYALKRNLKHSSFTVYENDLLRVIITGVGKAAAAAAVGYLGATSGGAQPWLNVGIAGHPDMEIGTPVVAHRITDCAAGRDWYPPLVFEPPCATAPVFTVDQPERGYASPGAVEMEAAGYFPAAIRFTSGELVQCVKIISDNARAPSDRLSAQTVSSLIAANIPVIHGIADRLRILQGDLDAACCPSALFDQLLVRHRFTANQRAELRKLLRRWFLLNDGTAPEMRLLEAPTAGALLARLAALVESSPIRF